VSPGRWLQGSGSPSPGRPQSSRQRISERLLSDLAEVWEEHGKDAPIKLAVSDPGKLVTVAYGLLPRDIFVRVTDQRGPMDREEMVRLRELVDLIDRAGGGNVDSAVVLDRMESDSRARLAKPVDSK
jgi:hypothetical protein